VSLQRARLLLLSANPDLVSQLKRVALQADCPPLDFTSTPPAEAMDTLSRQHPDLLLIDAADTSTTNLLHYLAAAPMPTLAIVDKIDPDIPLPFPTRMARTEISVQTLECLVRNLLATHAHNARSPQPLNPVMTHLSSIFQGFDPDDLEKNAKILLGALGNVLQAGRASTFLFSDDGGFACLHQSWENEIMPPAKETATLDCLDCQWLIQTLRQCHDIILTSPDALPPEAAAVAEWMNKRHAHNASLTPLASRRHALGFLLLENIPLPTPPPDACPLLQRIAARGLANALQCQRDARTLEETDNRIRAQFKAMPSPTFIWRKQDGAFVLADYNDAADRFTHGAVRVMTGKAAQKNRMPADIIANLHQCLNENHVLREERWYDFQYRKHRVLLDVAYIPVPPVDVMVHMVDITDARRTEEGLRASEERFRAIANYTCGWEGWVDGAGRHVWLNPGAERLTGYSVAEMLATPDFPLPLIHQDDMALASGAFLAAKEGTRGSGLELRVRRKDGGWLWIALSWQPIFDAQGKSMGFRYGAADITTRKEEEQRALILRDFALTLLSSPTLDAILNLSLDTAIRITQADCGGIYLTETGTGNLILHCHHGFEPATAEALRFVPADSMRAKLVMKGTPYYGTLPTNGSSASDTALSVALAGVWAVPILHEGQVLGCLNTGSWSKTDLSPARQNALETLAAQAGGAIVRIQSEEALRHSESKYRSVVENAWDGICIVREGLFEYVNPRMAQMIGLPAEAVLGMPLADHVMLPDLSTVPHQEYSQAEIKAASGGSLEAEINISRVNWNGNPSWLLMVWDVTERRRAERLIAEQQVALAGSARMSALGMMASGIAHEINNPLAIISGAAEQMEAALQAAAIDPVILRKHVDRIARQSSRIAKVIESFKVTARDGEKDPFQPVPVAQLLDDVRDMCQTRFRAHGIALEIPAIPNGLLLECRRAQITQVLLNLLANAFDAIDAQMERWIRIEMAESGGHLELAVVDSGRGMSAEVQARALDAFFTTKGVGKGSGLGLTISKGIVETHGGMLYIDAASTHTRIAMRLPLRRE